VLEEELCGPIRQLGAKSEPWGVHETC